MDDITAAVILAMWGAGFIAAGYALLGVFYLLDRRSDRIRKTK